MVRLNKEADTVTRELEVDVKFAQLPEPLVIGEEGEVDIDTGRQTAPAIPLSAVVERQGVKGVLVASKGVAHVPSRFPGRWTMGSRLRCWRA